MQLEPARFRRWRPKGRIELRQLATLSQAQSASVEPRCIEIDRLTALSCGCVQAARHWRWPAVVTVYFWGMPRFLPEFGRQWVHTPFNVIEPMPLGPCDSLSAAARVSRDSQQHRPVIQFIAASCARLARKQGQQQLIQLLNGRDHPGFIVASLEGGDHLRADGVQLLGTHA